MSRMSRQNERYLARIGAWLVKKNNTIGKGVNNTISAGGEDRPTRECIRYVPMW